MNRELLKYIQANTKYQGNEDLCEDFLAEASRRSLAVLENVDDIAFIAPYLKKVVNTSILTVLKNSGRVRRVKNEFVPAPVVVSLDDLSVNDDFEENITFSLDNLPDPDSNFYEKVDNRDLLAQVCNAVFVANSTNANKFYYDIFVKRYIESKKQSEIAQELGISQSEVCKRLYELVKIIKNDVIGY